MCECVSLRKRIKKLIPCIAHMIFFFLKPHPLTYNNNSNTYWELWISICEATQRITQLHILKHSSPQPLAALTPFCWWWHRAFVVIPASQSNMWSFYSYFTAVRIGWEYAWLRDRINTEIRLSVLHKGCVHTAGSLVFSWPSYLLVRFWSNMSHLPYWWFYRQEQKYSAANARK